MGMKWGLSKMVCSIRAMESNHLLHTGSEALHTQWISGSDQLHFLMSRWHLMGAFLLLFFFNLLCITSLSKFVRFLQVSLKGLFIRPWIISKYPKLVVNSKKARKSNSIWYKSLMLNAFGVTLQALWTVSLVFPFEFWSRAVLCLIFIFNRSNCSTIANRPSQVCTSARARSVLTQSSHYINSGTGSLTFIYQRKANTFSLSNLL